MEDAIFRKESLFQPANLQNHLKFWEEEILKDHPHRQSILGWLTGVRLEEFLNSFTTTVFQGEQTHSYYPEQKQFENYVPSEFKDFMNEQVQEWVNLGVWYKYSVSVPTTSRDKSGCIKCLNKNFWSPKKICDQSGTDTNVRFNS